MTRVLRESHKSRRPISGTPSPRPAAMAKPKVYTPEQRADLAAAVRALAAHHGWYLSKASLGRLASPSNSTIAWYTRKLRVCENLYLDMLEGKERNRDTSRQKYDFVNYRGDCELLRLHALVADRGCDERAAFTAGQLAELQQAMAQLGPGEQLQLGEQLPGELPGELPAVADPGEQLPGELPLLVWPVPAAAAQPAAADPAMFPWGHDETDVVAMLNPAPVAPAGQGPPSPIVRFT